MFLLQCIGTMQSSFFPVKKETAVFIVYFDSKRSCLHMLPITFKLFYYTNAGQWGQAVFFKQWLKKFFVIHIFWHTADG